MATQSPPNSLLTPSVRQSLLRPVAMPRLIPAISIVLLVAFVVWSMSGVEASVGRITHGVPLFINFFIDLWPPDWSRFTDMWEPVRVTIQMSVVGLLMSIIFAFPAALLAAKNTSPHPSVYQATRMLLNTIRAIPSLVWAIIVVASIGFGPLSGVLALGIAGIGTLGKLYSEAIEAVNPRQIEAVRATGAGSIQLFSFSVLPQAMPLMVSYTLLDFEGNVRSATILGIVGAGGIGYELQAAFSQFRFHEVFTILILIVVLVTVIDRLSSIIRSRLI